MPAPVISISDVDKSSVPRPHVEPSLSTPTAYSNVATVRAVVRSHDRGLFADSSLLVEQMLSNPRLRAVVETRLNGFISTAIRWEPGKQNAAGRRAAKAIAEDWPLIAPVPTRKQIHQWGLLLGVGFAQKHWYVSSTTRRLIPRLQVFHPQFTGWDWMQRQYRLLSDEGEQVYVESPSLSLSTQEGLGLWIVHEPFGQHSWRYGLMHAAWYAWLGHDWASRDQSRASEKLGVGVLKAKYPMGAQSTDHNRFISGMRTFGSEAVIPLPFSQELGEYDVQPLEWTGAGYEMIHRTKDSKAIDLAILFLGHNLTTEAKGGSYAAANVGDLIRGDIKAFDAEAEFATYRRQVLAPWALANFGDDECAPIAIYETDPPAINQTAAQTLQLLAQAAQQLRQIGNVDMTALLTRFRVPLNPTVAAPVMAQASPALDALEPAPTVIDGSKQASAADNAAPSITAAEAVLGITATDLASIVTVDEGRKSVRLPAVGGPIGAKWIREHGAQLAVELGVPGTAPTPAPTPGEDEGEDEDDDADDADDDAEKPAPPPKPESE